MSIVQGWGINDADYPVRKCPYYRRWAAMLRRALSPSSQKRTPSYIGTTICRDWQSFMAFRAWMVEQDWQGLELDKDLKGGDRKHYSPETCTFLSTFDNRRVSQGRYGQPVKQRSNKRRRRPDDNWR